MVTGDGDWKARWNADKTVLENHHHHPGIPLHRQRVKNSASMRTVMLLLVLPFSLWFWAVWLPSGEISVRFGFS